MKRIALLFTIFFSSSSYADVDFYSFGGFETVINGFTYMRDVYNDAQYSLLVFTILVMAVFISAGINSVKGLAGQSKSSQLLSSMFFCFLGFAIYQGTIVPKTQIHVYDTVLNKYQSVNNVPLLIATLAGGVNALERVGSDTLSSHPINRDSHGGGGTIQLLSEILNRDPLKYSPYLSKSLEHYIDDCMPPALTSNVGSYANFDLDKILHSTNDLVSELAKLASTYQMTLYYDSTNRAGINVTCSVSWSSISVLLTQPGTFNQHYDDACKMAGFESDLAICKSRLNTLSSFALDSTSAINVDTVAANQALAQNLYRNLASNPVAYMDDMINLKNQSAGLSTLVAAGSWLPTIRYSTMMIIVGILPLITLMFFTPMLGTALKYTAGLLVFIAIWGLTDTAIHGITMSSIEDQLSSIQTTNFSIYTFMTAPNELQKAVATMGKMQSMGLILATILVGIFFKISGHAFSNMGEKLSADIDRIGGETGREVFDPSTRMSTIDSYAQSSYKSENLGSMGTERYGSATSKPVAQQQIEDDKYFGRIGSSTMDAMHQEASIKAGDRAGITSMSQKISDNNNFDNVGDYTQNRAEDSYLNISEDIHSTRTARDITTKDTGYDNPIEVLTRGKMSDMADTQARSEVKDKISTVTNADNMVDAARKQANANVTYTATSDELKQLQDNAMGNVNSHSIAQAESNGGTVVTASFTDEPDGLNAFNVGTKVESSALDNGSSTINRGTQASRGAIVDLMKTVNNEIAHGEGKVLAEEALSGNDTAAELSVITGYSESLLARINASDADSTSKTLNGGISGDIPITGMIKGGLTSLQGLISKGVELPDGIGGKYSKPGKYDSAFDKSFDLIDKYIPGIDLNAGASISGTNTDRDSREISSEAFFGYVLNDYQKQYIKAQSDQEREDIANEWAVINEILIDSINAYAMDLAEDNIGDINENASLFFGDSVTDRMDDLRDLREEKLINR